MGSRVSVSLTHGGLVAVVGHYLTSGEDRVLLIRIDLSLCLEWSCGCRGSDVDPPRSLL